MISEISLHHMIEHDFAHPISTLSSFSLLAITILAARSNISITLEPVSAEHSAKLTASISCCSLIISLYLKKNILNFQKISSHFCLQTRYLFELTLLWSRYRLLNLILMRPGKSGRFHYVLLYLVSNGLEHLPKRSDDHTSTRVELYL